MSQQYNDNLKSINPCILRENSAEGLGSGREHCWCYKVSVWEYTLKLSGSKKGAVGA